MFGFLVINKSAGVSSRTALDVLSKRIRPVKVGHAGTLDPLATGVLVACVGPATRLVSLVQQLPKTYLGSFRLGFESESEDIESELIPVENAASITQHQLESVLPHFIGTIDQQPPQYSALRVDGKRAYQLARRGKEFKLKSRSIEIYNLELMRFEYPDFELKIHCGSGTYVRSLGRDIGRALNSGAVMTGLTRTAIGNFHLQDAHDSQTIREFIASPNPLSDILIPATGEQIGLRSVTLDEQQAVGLSHAIAVRLDDLKTETQLAAMDAQQRLLAILQRQSNGTYTPKLNFAPYWEGH